MTSRSDDGTQLAGFRPPRHGLRVDFEPPCDLSRCEEFIFVFSSLWHVKLTSSLREASLLEEQSSVSPTVPVALGVGKGA